MIQTRNNFAIQKLTLGRVIGLAPEQEFDRAVYHTMINTAIGEQAVLEIILDLAKTLHTQVTAPVLAK